MGSHFPGIKKKLKLPKYSRGNISSENLLNWTCVLNQNVIFGFIMKHSETFSIYSCGPIKEAITCGTIESKVLLLQFLWVMILGTDHQLHIIAITQWIFHREPTNLMPTMTLHFIHLELELEIPTWYLTYVICIGFCWLALLLFIKHY